MKHTAWRTLNRGGQFVLLGSAPDPKVQVRPTALRPVSSAGLAKIVLTLRKEVDGVLLSLAGRRTRKQCQQSVSSY